MTKLRIQDLSEELQDFYKQVDSWKAGNLKKTLISHPDGIETLLNKIQIYDIWSSCLASDVTDLLIPEIWIDSFSSVYFAGLGFYKYAYMCLRSELETALRMIFFYDHPVEYNWWLQGLQWAKSQNMNNVWGQGHTYFIFLFKGYEKEANDKCKIFTKNHVQNLYGALSQYSHSNADYLQTKPDRLAPTYDIGKFKRWESTWERVQNYVNIMLVYQFKDELRRYSEESAKKMLKVIIQTDYQEYVKSILEI